MFHAPPGASARIYTRICMHVTVAAALAAGLSVPAPLLGADIPRQGPVAYETTLLHQIDQRMRGLMEMAGQAAKRADDPPVGAFAAMLRERLPRIAGALDAAKPHGPAGPQTLDDDDQDLVRRLNTLSGDTVDDAFTQGAAQTLLWLTNAVRKLADQARTPVLRQQAEAQLPVLDDLRQTALDLATAHRAPEPVTDH